MNTAAQERVVAIAQLRLLQASRRGEGCDMCGGPAVYEIYFEKKRLCGECARQWIRWLLKSPDEINEDEGMGQFVPSEVRAFEAWRKHKKAEGKT